MIYVTSDLHGYPLEEFQKLLKMANFSENDFCFVLGDVIDRGEEGVKTLKWFMLQPNIQLLLGNHEAFLLSNQFLFEEITDNSVDQLSNTQIKMLSVWMENGGSTTIKELRKMPLDEIKDVVEYIKDAPLYESINVNGQEFLLTHSALDNFEKEKPLNQYTEHDFLWHRPSLEESFYDDVICVFGHTPTVLYGSSFKGKILKTPTWINADTGAACGFKPALLRLDDMKEFYLPD